MQTRSTCQAQVATSTSRYVSPSQPLPAFEPDRVAVYHVLCATKADLRRPAPEPLAQRIERLKLAPPLYDAVSNIAKSTYYAANEASFGAKMAARGQQRLTEMLQQDPQGFVYQKDLKTVAVLILLPKYAHPFLGTQTLHVAFWSYAREHLTADEAKSIKNDWLLQLCRAEAPRLSMQVARFNDSGLRFARSNGFKTIAFRVEHPHAS